MTTLLHPPVSTTATRATRAWAPKGAIVAVAAPLALAAAIALHPHDSSNAVESLARVADADRARWAIIHLLEPAAWLLVSLVLVAASRLGAGPGRALVRVGGVLAAIGAAASALIVYGHGEAILFMTGDGMDGPAMESLYEHYHDAMPLAGPLGLAFQLGLVVLGAGLYRSRAVPRWAAMALAVVPFGLMGSAEAPALVTAVVGAGPLVVGLAGSARAIGTITLRASA
jgi:hypothetical protein